MLKNPTSLLEISSRTVHKIVARAALSCSICQWNKATGDIHHIIEVSEGGSNAMTNLVYLCPNCHRCVHQLGEDFITTKELYKLSMDKTFPNWKDFYDIKNTSKIEEQTSFQKQCLECSKLVPHHRFFCSPSCGAVYNNRKRKENPKHTKEELIQILTDNNGILTKCGKTLNMSDNAFKKQCISHGITPADYKIKYKRKDTFIL